MLSTMKKTGLFALVGLLVSGAGAPAFAGRQANCISQCQRVVSSCQVELEKKATPESTECQHKENRCIKTCEQKYKD